MSIHSPKSEALKALYWRSEILRLMYWLRGEGYGDLVDPPMLQKFLGIRARSGLSYLNRLVEDGYLVRDGEWYALSELGRAEGEEEYLSAFSDLLRPTHGSCSPDCWCEMSAEEAEVCAAQRERNIPKR